MVVFRFTFSNFLRFAAYFASDKRKRYAFYFYLIFAIYIYKKKEKLAHIPLRFVFGEMYHL